MIRNFIWTYLCLTTLLLLTVLEYEYHFTPFAMGVSLLIAALKASLVTLIFMDLKNEPALIRFTALAGLFWIFIFYALSSLDLVS